MGHRVGDVVDPQASPTSILKLIATSVRPPSQGFGVEVPGTPDCLALQIETKDAPDRCPAHPRILDSTSTTLLALIVGHAAG